MFEKKKPLIGIENVSMVNIEVPINESLEGIMKNEKKAQDQLKHFDFDLVLNKITELEKRVGGFKNSKFRRLVKGCRVINNKMAYLKGII